jgi:pyruvate,orthophosphate dikinase
MKLGRQVPHAGIRTNADTPADAQRAREFGAEGIGLCRTEHMFFEGDRIKAMREMILAETEVDRKKALAKLLPFQREDFIGIFKAMKGLPVTIRLLRSAAARVPPARRQGRRAEWRKAIGVKVVIELASRSCTNEPDARPPRLPPGVTYPEILEMQVRAIVEAAIECKSEEDRSPAEIMIPLVGTEAELASSASWSRRRSKRGQGRARSSSRKLDIKIGTMIEIPRAALTADEIAEHADFFSSAPTT